MPEETAPMQLSENKETVTMVMAEGSGKGAIQLLADRYSKRLARINARLAKKTETIVTDDGAVEVVPFVIRHDPAPYYDQAEAAVRALYADAT
jgi:ABC-type Zn2+ transport system substrate-binding protein/surface adhesin